LVANSRFWPPRRVYKKRSLNHADGEFVVTLEQLRIFVAVAEREHVTQAAQALNLTQSAVSSAIAALEQRHDVKLFDRIGRRIALTEDGKLFVGEARALLARARATEQVLADLGGLRTGALKLAASQTIGNYWLPARLALYAQKFPGVAVHLTIGNTHDVALLASAGEIDLGFVEGEEEQPGLEQTPFAEDELIVVASPALAAQFEDCAPQKMFEAPWVAREKGSGTRSAFEKTVQEFAPDAPPRKIVLELPSNEAVRMAVEAGAGLAVMSHLVAAAALDSGALIRLPCELPKRPFYLLTHRQLYRSRAAQALIDLL
jgi:DNA-binding transcriptional LysR family regulator